LVRLVCDGFGFFVVSGYDCDRAFFESRLCSVYYSYFIVFISFSLRFVRSSLIDFCQRLGLVIVASLIIDHHATAGRQEIEHCCWALGSIV
jgi:hypothetical protein